MKSATDVVIIGGGMVGSLAAAALARAGMEVAVVESARPEPFDAAQPYDLRVSALSVASEQMLAAVGAWPAIERMRLCPFRRMAVWDGGTGTETRFNSADIGQSRLGHIVENRVIQLGLWQVLEQSAQVAWHCPAQLERFEFADDRVEVYLDNGSVISADLLIAADGARSSARSLAGIECVGNAYEQHALVASVTTQSAQQDITWQQFVDTGPQAFLPLAGRRGSLVWYHFADRVRELKQLPLASLQQRIEREFPERLGRLDGIEGVASFPIHWSHARRYVQHRFALIGDAAHSVHPLAGQGVNMGLLDAAALVEVLVDASKAGKDPGALRVLRRYERWRRGENSLMIKSLDFTHRVFEPGHSGFKVLRNAALASAAGVAPLNRLLMKVAMGLAGDLPKLAQGRMPA